MHMHPFQIQIWSEFANNFTTPLIPMDSSTHQKLYLKYTTSLHDQSFQMNFHAFKCIWNSSTNQMEFEFSFQMQYTPFKWNDQHISTMNITLYNWSCACALYIMLITLFVLFARIEVEPEPEVTPFVEDTVCEPCQQGKQTPIDHVDKIPLPSHVSLMHCLGRSPW